MKHLAPLPALLLAALLPGAAVAANPFEDFYKGKVITMVVPTAAGGDYDRIGRAIAMYMPGHIPGSPTIIVQNMPGGVGLEAANWLAQVAPRDGTALEMMIQNMPTHQALAGVGTRFDVRRFAFIGNVVDSPNVFVTWSRTGVTSIEQAKHKEVSVGAAGTATAAVYYPEMMNALLGTKFKIIAGYPSGNDANLAMERGEVDARGSSPWRSYVDTHPEWIRDKKLNALVQIGPRPDKALPDVPLLTSLAPDDLSRQAFAFISGDVGVSRPLVTTPAVPPDRVAALRKAFDDTMKDPAFIAQATKMKVELNPISGEQAQKIADAIVNTRPEVVKLVKGILDAPVK